MPANTNSTDAYAPLDSTAVARRAVAFVGTYLVEIILIALIVYLCVSRGLTIGIDVYDPDAVQPAAPGVEQTITGGTPEPTGQLGLAAAEQSGVLSGLAAGAVGVFDWVRTRVRAQQTETTVFTDQGTPQLTSPGGKPLLTGFDEFGSVARTDDPAPHISNLTLVLSPDYGERKGWSEGLIAAKRQRVQNYIATYATIAQREMRTHGIPASITLAQGILESNAGDSKLAVRSLNHFGIKCRKKCLGCTCRNYSDDSRYDMFRVFESAAESFREHSELLNTPRYAKLKAHGTDYRKWAHGLKACGYATDKRYGHKLVTIIENLRLDTYDQ